VNSIMDFARLAEHFLRQRYGAIKHGPHQGIDASLRGESFVLFYLWRQDKSTLPSDISAAMNVSSARIAAALNSLEGKGLVTRRIDTADRRRVLIDLTPAGEALADQRHQELLKNTTRLLELLGERDAEEFVRIWDRLTEIAPQLRHLDKGT